MVFVFSIENLKTLNNNTFSKNIGSLYFCSKCENQDEKIFKKEESIKILKSFGLIMAKENINQEFRLESIDKTRDYLVVEIEQNE